MRKELSGKTLLTVTLLCLSYYYFIDKGIIGATVGTLGTFTFFLMIVAFSREYKRWKILYILAVFIIIVAGFLIFNKSDSKQVPRSASIMEDTVAIGGGGERIYLKDGLIYAFVDDPEKEYNVVAFTIHVTSEQFKRIVSFETPKAAEAQGYKPSEHFARDYACWKAGKDWIDCYEDK